MSGGGSPRPAAALFFVLDIALAGLSAYMTVLILAPLDCAERICEATVAEIVAVIGIPVALSAAGAALLCLRVMRRSDLFVAALRASGVALGIGVLWLAVVFSVLAALATSH